MVITKKMRIAWLVLVVVLLVLSCAYYFYLKSKLIQSPPTVPMTDAQRLELLNKPSDIPPINPTMTDKQREELLNKPSNVPPITN